MSDLGDRLQQEFEHLKTKRDELRVQLDLGKKDVEDAWHEAEQKWQKLESHVQRLAREGAETLEDIGEAAELLVDEIKTGLQDLRKLL